MSEDLEFTSHQVPSRIANLGFAVQLPRDWKLHDLPEEEPNFEQQSQFFTLAIAAAPYAALVFAAAARPAFDGGSVHDWALWLIEQNGLAPRAIGPGTLGTLAAVQGNLVSEGDLGPMLTFFAFAEDGGRLLHVSVTGPEPLQAQVFRAWQAVTESFTLESASEATVPVIGNSAMPAPTPVASSGDVSVAEAPAEGGAKDDAQPHLDPSLGPDLSAYALGSASTLDPENLINRNLRESGQGFVPRLLALDEPHGQAQLASMALMATLWVPLGWHAIDDGQRLRLLDPSGEVQIHLHLLDAPGNNLNQQLDEIESQARADYGAAIETFRMAQGDMVALGVRGITDGDQALEQFHLLMATPMEGKAIRARVTTVPERTKWALDLGQLILVHLRWLRGDEPPPRQPDQPGTPNPSWWECAQALERAGQLEQAERLVRDAVPHLGAAMSIAELYAERMRRLRAQDDQPGAAQAHAKAVEWAQTYAGWATSGGEGAALSRERDTFIVNLGPAP